MDGLDGTDVLSFCQLRRTWYVNTCFGNGWSGITRQPTSRKQQRKESQEQTEEPMVPTAGGHKVCWMTIRSFRGNHGGSHEARHARRLAVVEPNVPRGCTAVARGMVVVYQPRRTYPQQWAFTVTSTKRKKGSVLRLLGVGHRSQAKWLRGRVPNNLCVITYSNIPSICRS